MADFADKGMAVANYASESDAPRQSLLRLWTRGWYHFGGKDVVFVPVRDDGLGAAKDELDNNVNDSVDESVFSDGRTADVYTPIEKYEGRHRFDPKATWTEEEEIALVRRVSPSRIEETDMKIAKLTQYSWTGRYVCGSALCSLPCSSIVGTSRRRFQILF